MTEQGITQEDQGWIAQRMCAHGSMQDDMRAAIARGYERGRDMHLDALAKCRDIAAKASGIGFADSAVAASAIGDPHCVPDAVDEAFAALIADRDRLAKRCEELERLYQRERSLLAEQCIADIRSTDRLAALEQRVGALVEAIYDRHKMEGWSPVREYRSRLAALRSPQPDPFRQQVERDHILDGLRAQVAARDAEIERLKATSERLKDQRDALDNNLTDCQAANREYVERLVARDAEIAGLKREVETIQSKLAGAEHAIADLTTTFGTVESERNTLRARVAELEARPDPARGLIERAAKVLETYVPLSEDELLADLRAYLAAKEGR